MTRSATTIVLRDGRPRAIEIRGAELVVASGPDEGRRAKIAGRRLSIGSDPANDLVLSDRAVSRFHCRIEAGDEFVLRDLGSSNGTLVQGVRIRECVIDDGQRIAVGECSIVFKHETDSVEVPLSEESAFGGAIGDSVPMRELFGTLVRVAPTDAPILLVGETGTGKEVIAEAIHQRSRRNAAPFEIIDCGALAPSIVEAELFGYERGAFTGAVEARAGVFERAHRGTVFLDEIGELPRDLQPKLLRVLESGHLRRLGGAKTVAVDVRLVAATHRDLDAMVAAGTFRADLYHRLAVVRARVPPLRERPDDIALLAAHFLQNTRYLHDVEPYVLKNYVAMALSSLRAYTWPGNVRELRNVVECAAILADPEKIRADVVTRLGAIQKEIAVSQRPGRLPMRIAVENFEREYLIELVRGAGRSIHTAAQIAQIHPKSLERLLRKHGLRARDM